MTFTIELDRTPATGHELATLIRRAADNIRYNIGPDPLRETTGPVYSLDHEGKPLERIGTWKIEGL